MLIPEKMYVRNGINSAVRREDAVKNIINALGEIIDLIISAFLCMQYNNTEDIPRLYRRRGIFSRSVGVQSPTERKQFFELTLLVKSRALNNTEDIRSLYRLRGYSLFSEEVLSLGLLKAEI